ncbi:AMP-binding protein, partial [Saccharothrix sp. MB29]|nr:AMP-binding protein [Saccharothrix sp. MB29]
SYLPLCHVAERIFTTWFSASAGIRVHFAESIETVQPNLREVQPTILFAVPRIWEKVLASITISAASATRLKRVTTRFWLRVADRLG